MTELLCTLLGTGTSYGVPMIGCDCAVCRSQDPRDRRLRPAAWLHSPDPEQSISILIDFGCDLREQAIRANIRRLDAVFLTHTHADHLNGIDDLRGFTRIAKAPLPFFASSKDIQFVTSHFEYCFPQPSQQAIPHIMLPQLEPRPVKTSPVHIAGLTIVPVPLLHGRMGATGWRIGNFAYLTDCAGIPEESFPLLQGVELLVIDGLRWCPHPTHCGFDAATALARRIGATSTWLTHINHDIQHAVDDTKLQPGIHLAYDGLTIPFQLTDCNNYPTEPV
ncbi:MAG: MBL fold metallo-hydrolase [Victivallales bacterium]|nr:MBL fold metallo-hydrolase [Victivallales bacterium]